MSDKILFQIPGSLSGIKTMAHFWRITFDTQENISSEALARFTELRDKFGWMTVSVNLIQPEDILDLPDIKSVEPDEPSPGKKLRNALYRLWEKVPENFKTDEEHYKFYMEKFRQHVLNKIPRE